MQELDITPIVLNVLLSFWWFIPLLIIIAFLKSSYFKGKIGELIVNSNNGFKLNKSIYTSLKDITLKLNDSSTTQIDHIVVSKFGIFIIETKNMQGWIYGSKRRKVWTQNIYGNKHTFQNPLHQNYKHIKAIEEILNLDKYIYSIVVFVGECEFKTTIPDNVFINYKYIDYIKSFDYMVFEDSVVNQIISKIEHMKLKKGFKTDIEHINSLKKKKY